MKKFFFVLPVILLIAAGCKPVRTSQPTNSEVQKIQQSQVNLAVPDAPTLYYYSESSKPFVQIVWNYEAADYFNIYRSIYPDTGWVKIAANYPGRGHASTDFDYPKEVKTLYYRISSSDNKGNESGFSPASSVNLTLSEAKQIVSNIFSYKAKPGDKVGGMTLIKINSNNSIVPATADNVYAEFSGTITLTGKLSAPTGNPADAGMGPQYSLNDITKDSLKLLPYLQSDTRTVWFGVSNSAIMGNFSVKNGDLVNMTIGKYYYTYFPAGVWNQADVISLTKAQLSN